MIIVTGANSIKGIGRASAHQFALNGARAIYLCDYAEQYLAAHQRELQQRYGNVDVHVRRLDAADEAAVKEVVEDAVERYGRLDVFFANAGVLGTSKIFSDVQGGEFMQTMKTNVLRWATRRCGRHAARLTLSTASS